MSYNPFGNIGGGGGAAASSSSSSLAAAPSSRLPLPPNSSSSQSDILASGLGAGVGGGGGVAGGLLSNLRHGQPVQQQQQRLQQQLQPNPNATILGGGGGGGINRPAGAVVIGSNTNPIGMPNTGGVGGPMSTLGGGSAILTGNNNGNNNTALSSVVARNAPNNNNNNSIINPAMPIRPPPQPTDELHSLVLQLIDRDQREGALLELSKRRENFPDLAPILWHTVGCVAALLQEIASIYPSLAPPTLAAHASNRCCNALALLQCVASHPDTRSLFLGAHVPLYLYPFLNTQSKSRPFEYLRLTSLGVVGALVKMDDADVINFLLQTEIIPLCLRIMESGSELSKTVATFIVQKILLDDVGLGYVCATAERFYAVSTVLNNMVGALASSPSVRLLKHIVRCYLRLSDNTRARDALRQALPASLRDDTFAAALRDDVTVKKWLGQLLSVVGPPDQSLPQGAQASGGMMGGGGGMGGSRLVIASVGGVGGGGGGEGVDLQ
ncbi:hypothetical protein ACHAWU_002652 [Discostella pseudostelligera]|uniref:Cell differentiation protein rcd1 n=1 Tax=Discostella pseudostelligera TaxID=259834 RepID=A0ABD3LX82_9STRA